MFCGHHIFLNPDLGQNHVWLSSSESRFQTKTMSDCCHLRRPDFCVHQIFLYRNILLLLFFYIAQQALGVICNIENKQRIAYNPSLHRG